MKRDNSFGIIGRSLAARSRTAAAMLSSVAVAVVIAVAAGMLPTDSGRVTATIAPPTVSAPGPAVPAGAHRLQYPAESADPAQNHGDLYLPAGTNRVAVVVLLHGGGWQNRFGAAVLNDVAQRLVLGGVAVWNLEYRRVGSGGGWPRTFLDVAAGVDHLTALQRNNPRIDLSRVVVVGHSAGGQLAAWTASRSVLADGEPGAHPRVVPMHVFSLAGVLDMRTAADSGNSRVVRVLGGSPASVSERYRAVSPVDRLSRRTPITVYHGTRDDIVPLTQATTFYARARHAGIAVRCIVIRGATHPSLVDAASPDWARIERDVLTVAYASPTRRTS